jgi:hypothetical protein
VDERIDHHYQYGQLLIVTLEIDHVQVLTRPRIDDLPALSELLLIINDLDLKVLLLHLCLQYVVDDT